MLKIPDDASDQFRTSGPVPPLPPGAFTLHEMRDRLARQRLNDAETYMTVEEEAAVLADLEEDIRAQNEQDSDLHDITGHYASSGLEDPDSGAQKSDGRAGLSPVPPSSYRSAGRPYGIGSSDAMREAEMMRKAKRTVERQRQSPMIGQSTAFPSKGDDVEALTDELDYSVASSGRVTPRDSTRASVPRKRESALEGMSTAARNRVSRALLQVEADMLADSMRNLQANPPPTEAWESTQTPAKRMGSSRRNVSISRSPAFHDRLADVADATSGPVNGEMLTQPEGGAATIVTQSHYYDDDVFSDNTGAAHGSVALERALVPSAEPVILASSKSHRPHPLHLATNGSQALTAQHEHEASLPPGPSSSNMFLLGTDGTSKPGHPSATSKSSFMSTRTGSYVAETPPESAQLRVPQQELSFEQPFPSPQSATFDISGYYGDDRDSDIEQEASPIAAGADLTSVRSTYSSDYRSSPVESDYDAVPAFSIQDRRSGQSTMPQSTRQSEKELGLSSSDLHHVQDKLTEAARQARRTMNEGATVGLPGSPTKSSRRLSNSRQPYSQDQPVDEAVHQSSSHTGEAPYLRHAADDLSSRPPHTIARRLSLLSLTEPVEVPAVNPAQVPQLRNRAPPQLNDTWTDPKMAHIQNTQTSPRRTGGTAIDPIDHEAAKSRLAQALFGPAEALGGPPSPVGPTHSHRRLESTSSARSYRIDEDPDVRRDFEARIAQATAALQKTPSTRLSRKNTRNKAIKIGSPTLLQTSANLQVSPLTSPQVVQGGFASPGTSLGQSMPRTRHGKSASVSSLANVETASSPANGSTVASGLKGLLAKIKRKPSQKKPEATKPTPASRSVVNPSIGQSQERRALPIDVNLDSSKALSPAAARRSVVRRTIIVPTSTNTMPSIAQISTRTGTELMSSGPPERSLSIKRKPVQRTSEDIVLENQLNALPNTAVAVPRSRQSSASDRNSVFDLYRAGDTHETTQESSVRPGIGAGSGQVLEIRELSDGEVTWGLVRGQRESTREDMTPQKANLAAESARESVQDFSSASSYRKASISSNNFDLDEEDQDAAWSEAERELLDSPAERPQTKVHSDRSNWTAESANEKSWICRCSTPLQATCRICWQIFQIRTMMGTSGFCPRQRTTRFTKIIQLLVRWRAITALNRDCR